jgi:hypothetical protein
MASEYRRKIGCATWHFCSNCSQWPTSNYICLKEEPRTHQTCNECIVRQHEDKCD